MTMDYSLRTLQLHLLDILTVIDRVCREHGLRYYLAAGTMLGAVRHGGFIPWDDDADICMPRSDYDRLMKHAKEWMHHPYEVLCAENDKAYPSDFAKVVDSSTTLIERQHHSFVGGLYVDVFPIDSITGNRFSQHIHMARYSMLKKILYLLCRDPYKNGHGSSSWMPLLCQKMLNTTDIVSRLLRLQQAYPAKAGGKHSLCVDHDFRMRGIMPMEVYGNPTEIEFEGHRLYGIEQADTYLTNLYGDYMQMPDTDHRKQHNFFFIDYNRPYRTYKDTRQFVTKARL